MDNNLAPHKKIYYLKLQSDGRPKIKNDQVLTVEKGVILHIEMIKGTSITNQVAFLSNAKENFPFGIIDKQIKEGKINREILKPYIFTPIEDSTSLVYEIELNNSGPVQFLFIY